MAETRLIGLLRQLQPTLPTDREALAAFVARRDEAAFAAIVRRHGPMILRVCRRVLRHDQDAEDACQATFLVLARKAGTVGRAEALANWLHGVAVRTALRARRDAARRQARDQLAAVAAPADPAEALAWHDVQVLLETEIERLPPAFRAAFVLCHLQGRSRAEAAADLGISENTLSSRLARARDRLQRRLAHRGVHLSAALAATALAADATGSAIPTNFFERTIQSATEFAARQPVTGLTDHALQLTQGALTTMAIARLKIVAGLLAVGGVLAAGAWGAGQGPGRPPGGLKPPAADPPAARADTPERTADYAQRRRSLKNLKQILLAMHNYHNTYNRFPTDITDKAGKPLLSWRVELLPFLEHDALYREFRRTEPWDSEHNLKLLAKMPDVYRVGFEPKDATHTYYQRFAIVGGDWPQGGGEGGMGGGSPGMPGSPGSAPGLPGAIPGLPVPPPGAPPGIGAPRLPPAVPVGGLGAMGPGGSMPPTATAPRFPESMAEVTDGTSNTLGVIETGPPVPWTKPADLVYHRNKPLPTMTGPFANVRHAATLDGATHSLRPKLDEKTLRLFIDPNDGHILPELKTLRAHLPAESADEKKALARLQEENRALIEAIEKLQAENAELLKTLNQKSNSVDRVEADQDNLKRMLNALRAENKRYRSELGGPGAQAAPREAAPKGPGGNGTAQ